MKLSKISNSPKVVPVSESMNAAAKEIKDNMTEVQKSALYLKEVSGPKSTLSHVSLKRAAAMWDGISSSFPPGYISFWKYGRLLTNVVLSIDHFYSQPGV